MALQIRRGTNAERLGITLVEGEVVYVTDFELATIEVTSVDAATNTLTTTLNHGLTVGAQIKFQSLSANGLVIGTVYYVKTAPTITTFTLSATLNGTTLDITGTATSLIFATGPRDSLGTPYGYTISALYVGDGVTAGGNPAGASVLDDLYDVEIGVYGNVGQYGEALANNNVFQYNSTTQQWENRANLTVSGNITATGVYSQAGDTLKINSDGTAANSILYMKGTDEYLLWDNTNNNFYFSDKLVIEDELKINGNAIQSSTGAQAITLSGSDVTVVGNLTVSGTTTTVNSTTLTVDDKNIELAATATPSDTNANGGGITLKGTTDKKIYWSNSDDRWYYDNGDGASNIFVRDLTDLSNVETTSFTKGDLFVYDGTNWINDNKIQADNTNQRAVFQYNNNDVGTSPSGLFARRNFTTPSTFAAGDGTGIGFQLSNDNGAHTTFATVAALYDPSVSSVILNTSTDNFDANRLTVASFDSTQAKLYGTKLLFRSAFTGTPANGEDITIEVERGTATNATIAWVENGDFWNLSNDVYSGANLIAGTNIGLNGNIISFNNADATPSGNYSLVVKRGASADVALRWNESSDRWESTLDGSTYVELPNQGLDQNDTPTFAGTVSGNVRVGVASDNEIDTSTGNLTIDSAGGTTTIDDDVVVSGSITHNGATATFNNAVILGSSGTDAVTVNGALEALGNTQVTDLQVIGNTVLGSNTSDTIDVLALVNNNITFTDNSTTTNRGITGTVGSNDYWKYGGGASGADAGYAEIATGDNGTEPIYARQYNAGTPRTLTLMDANGHTILAGDLTVGGNDIKTQDGTTALTFSNATGDVTVNGDLIVVGNDIKTSGGNTNITMTSNTLTTFAGDIQLGGNDIKDSAGTTKITLANNGVDTWTQFNGGVLCGYLFMDNRALLNTGALTTTTTTANQVLDSFPAATYRSCKYYVQITSGSEYQAFEGIVVHNGTSAFLTAFNDVRTNGNLSTIGADVSGGNVRLLVTPVNAATVFKITKTLMVV
jgi:hypothetical protein